MRVELEDRVAITEVNAAFAWALDLHDWDQLRDLLTDDIHYRSRGLDLRGADAVVASFRSRPGGRTTRHGLGNLQLRQDEANTILGRSSWHTFASNTPPAFGVPLYLVADFHDTYTRADTNSRDDTGGWRIAERVIMPVFCDPSLAPQKRPE